MFISEEIMLSKFRFITIYTRIAYLYICCLNFYIDTALVNTNRDNGTNNSNSQLLHKLNRLIRRLLSLKIT